MTRLAVVLALLSGCSIAFQSKPHKTTDCTTSNAFAIVDSAGVVAAVAATVIGAFTPHKEMTFPLPLVGLGYLASAGNGSRWASQCRSRGESVAAQMMPPVPSPSSPNFVGSGF